MKRDRRCPRGLLSLTVIITRGYLVFEIKKKYIQKKIKNNFIEQLKLKPVQYDENSLNKTKEEIILNKDT